MLRVEFIIAPAECLAHKVSQSPALAPRPHHSNAYYNLIYFGIEITEYHWAQKEY